MNIQKMMQQAQKMQRDMAKIQSELESKTYQATKTGMVSVEVNGKFEVTSVKIEEELLSPEYKEELETAMLLVMTEAMQKANDDKEKTMGQLTNGMNIPGLF